MYNRYVPRSDGSYCRTRVPDSPPRQAAVPQPKQNIPAEACAEEPAASKAILAPASCRKPSGCGKPMPRKPAAQNPSCGSSLGSFLKQILPKNFDTADLIVVLLLLLISGDSTEDQNNALLTLALYLFM